MGHSPASCRAGVGLLEMLLAVVLLVMGVVAVVNVMSSGLFADHSVDRRAVALKLAQQKMEDIKNTAYASIASESDAAISSPTGFSDYNRQVVVSGNVGDHDLLTVTVYISWYEKMQSNSLSLTTLIADASYNG